MKNFNLKTTFSIIFSFFLVNSTLAQVNTENDASDEFIYVEEKAQFLPSNDSLYSFISANFNMPKDFKQKNAAATVLVCFKESSRILKLHNVLHARLLTITVNK